MRPELNRVLPDGAINFGGGIIGPSAADRAQSNSQTEPLHSTSHGTRNTIFETGALLGTIAMVEACSPGGAPAQQTATHEPQSNLPSASQGLLSPDASPSVSQSQEPSPSASDQTPSQSPDASPSQSVEPSASPTETPAPTELTVEMRKEIAHQIENEIINQKASEIKATTITNLKNEINALWTNNTFKSELSQIAKSGQVDNLSLNYMLNYINPLVTGKSKNESNVTLSYNEKIDKRIQFAGGFIGLQLDLYGLANDPDLKNALKQLADKIYDYARTQIPPYPNAPQRNTENLTHSIDTAIDNRIQ